MIGAVFLKELIDNLRDRRSVASALIYPLIGPVVLGFAFTLVGDWQRTDRPLELPVVGAEHAPQMVAFLAQHGAEIRPAPADPEAAVRDGKAKAVLVIPENFAREFRAGRPASVQLLVDESSNKARGATQRAQRLLANYSSQIGSLRLLARGISPDLAAPVLVERVDLATPEKLAASVLNMLPLFLLLAAFLGGMHVAIDATAGERERGSLEPLLLNPVPRWKLVVGKWAATLVFSSCVVALTLSGFALMTRVVSLDGLGLDLNLGAREIGGTLIAALPLTLLAGALQLLVATFARSFKEAQTYISLLLFAPMLPGLVFGLVPLQSETWMMLIPGLSQQLLVSDLIGGQTPSPLAFALAAGSTALLATAILAVTATLFTHEKIVFGR